MSGEPRIIHILMVDDDPADVRITKEALKDSKFLNQMHVCQDGTEALQFLRREGEHKDAQRPDLILLDINMPRMDGHQTLHFIKSDPGLKDIPVVMLTTSNADKDVVKAYSEHANAYVTKPVDLDRFFQIISEIQDFWIGIVRLPARLA